MSQCRLYLFENSTFSEKCVDFAVGHGTKKNSVLQSSSKVENPFSIFLVFSGESYSQAHAEVHTIQKRRKPSSFRTDSMRGSILI